MLPTVVKIQWLDNNYIKLHSDGIIYGNDLILNWIYSLPHIVPRAMHLQQYFIPILKA